MLSPGKQRRIEQTWAWICYLYYEMIQLDSYQIKARQQKHRAKKKRPRIYFRFFFWYHLLLLLSFIREKQNTQKKNKVFFFLLWKLTLMMSFLLRLLAIWVWISSVLYQQFGFVSSVCKLLGWYFNDLTHVFVSE